MNQPTVPDRRLDELRACQSLAEIVPLRAHTHPAAIALRQHNRATNQWESVSYQELAERIERWRRALAATLSERGARVAILLGNSIPAVLADQAALANALVSVPLHAIDTPASSAYIIADSGSQVLFVSKGERWQAIRGAGQDLSALRQVVLVEEEGDPRREGQIEVVGLASWLSRGNPKAPLPEGPGREDLAGLIYTSGTTGQPKGVMLTHGNILSNIIATLEHIAPLPGVGYKLLSFLPLSHTFERSCGYYLILGMACEITYARSIMLLAEDMRRVRPHAIISVPRIYERAYARLCDQLARSSAPVRWLFRAAVAVGWRRFCRRNQISPGFNLWSWADPLVGPPLDRLVGAKVRAQFGGRLRIAISGGAAINHKVAEVFCALGVVPIAGYGMTEVAPIISGNSPWLNHPDTVGKAIGCDIRLAPENGEIQVRGPSVMRGYWHRPEDTARAFTEDGWLRTGDVGEFTPAGMLRIRGRIKEILVTSTGEKVPPVDLELALETDQLFAQTMVIGDDRPYITMLAVLNPTEWSRLAAELGVDPNAADALRAPAVRSALLRRAKTAATGFPQYALPRAVYATLEPWTIENGLLTPTLKLKRGPLMARFADQIEELYAIHR